MIPRNLIRYIRCVDQAERNAIGAVIDAHQLRAYVMYPALTSSSERDLGRTLWNREWPLIILGYSNKKHKLMEFFFELGAFAYRFEIKSETAIDIQRFSVHRGEFEFVFPPGAIFRVLKRDGLLFTIEEVIPQRLRAKRAKLPW